MMPGRVPVGACGRPYEPVESITFVSLSSNSNVLATTPKIASYPASGIQAGDIIIIHALTVEDAVDNLQPFDIDGFITIGAERNDLGSLTFMHQAWAKIADGTENGTDEVMPPEAAANDTEFSVTVSVYHPNTPAAVLTPGGFVGNASDGNPSSSIVLAAAATPPLIIQALYSSINDTTGVSFSPADDGSDNLFANDVTWAYKIYNSSPADTTIDIGDSGSGNAYSAFYLSVF